MRALRPLALSATLLVGAGCATTKPAPTSSATAAPGKNTPEIPYQPGKSAPPPGAPAQLPAGQIATKDSEARAAFERALQASAKGDALTAERELKAALKRDEKLDYAWTNLGVIYEREALVDQAEKAYRKALELRPDQEAAWDYLTRLYCRRGQAGQIESQLRARIQEFPAALGLRTALVVGLVCQNKLEDGASEAKKILKSDERNVRAMQLLAQIYYREKKFELAKMVLENAKAVGPGEASTHNALGLVNLALKQRPAAMENFKEAARLRPDFAEAKNNYGAMLNEAQDYDSAAKELEAAVNAAPDFASARLNLGNAYRGRQDYAKAISQYKQVLRMRPELPDTYFNLAILHLDSEIPNLDTVERYKTSISYFEQFRSKGGKDERVEQYIKDANKGIEKEERRRERERKEQLKKAEPGPSQPAAKPAASGKLPGSRK